MKIIFKKHVSITPAELVKLVNPPLVSYSVVMTSCSICFSSRRARELSNIVRRKGEGREEQRRIEQKFSHGYLPVEASPHHRLVAAEKFEDVVGGDEAVHFCLCNDACSCSLVPTLQEGKLAEN